MASGGTSSSAAAAVAAGLLGTEADSHAVAMACRLAHSMQATVYLIYLLVVPRNKPLLAALGDQEEAARGALEQLETAVRTARLRPAARVERTRDPAGRLVAVASEVRADAITLALPPDSSEELSAIAETVLARADCDVVINRLPALLAAALPTAPAALTAGGNRH
jgi:nucleotide-binding universal stress UspA family protein